MKALYPIVGIEFKVKRKFVDDLPTGTALTLKREPDNKFDKNAVGVWFEDKQIGYIPKKDNSSIAMAMDSNAELTPKGKLVFSSNSRYPHIEVEE